jgi:hypothetical protein
MLMLPDSISFSGGLGRFVFVVALYLINLIDCDVHQFMSRSSSA